jgi:hypothetical protein
MATTFTKIASVDVGLLGAASIDFTSIPSTYTDLVVYTSARTNRASNNADPIKCQFNGDTGNNYSLRFLTGSGSTASSGSASGINYNIAGTATATTATASTFGNAMLYIPNYASANYKSSSMDGVAENNATAAVDRFEANLWSSTAAITSISLTPNTGTAFNQYSTATLYGINKS